MNSTDIIGGSVCGSVRCTCEADPLVQTIRHYKNCQKQAGTAYLMIIGVPHEALKVTGRPLKAYSDKGDSGGKLTRFFCDQCGAPVISDGEIYPELLFIKAGTFDDANVFEPEGEIWTESKFTFAIRSGDL